MTPEANAEALRLMLRKIARDLAKNRKMLKTKKKSYSAAQVHLMFDGTELLLEQFVLLLDALVSSLVESSLPPKESSVN